jgi:penicillin-binding protein 1A
VAGTQGRNGGGPQRRRSRRADLEFERLLAARHSRVRRRHRKRRSILLLLALLLVSIVALVLATVAFTGSSILLSTCSLSDLRPLSLGENSFLYTDQNRLLGVVPSATNRQPLPLAKISPWLPQATVAIEDARFWQHGALDYQGIARAFYQDVTQGHIVQGGSTITQELVRNLYIGNPQRTISRKIREACLAEKIFQNHTRKQILADYLNEVFYGRHAFGAQAAAQTYFSKSASQLTLAQAALLAGLPQAPSVDDPISNPHAALARRNEVLQAMWKNGYIDAKKLRQAEHKPLLLRPGNLYTQLHQPNFFGWATQQLAKKFGQRGVELGGLKVRTTLDTRLQGLAYHAVISVLHSPGDPAAAIVSIDPRTGAVKAMVDYLPNHRNLQFNLATQAHRSTGSSFKPITLATALSEGDSLYSTFYGPPELFITDPQCATGPNSGPWDVHNFADEQAGTMNLLDATANSVNTIFAQLIAKVGVRNVMAMAHRLGITSSGKNFVPACAITLGSVGFTPLEMTDVYATFASGGVHHVPQAFENVRLPSGKEIKLNPNGQRVLGPNVAAELTYALQGVVQHGTGTAAALGSRPVAGKTGTANDFQDAWFCGYVPQLATCVWVGYPAGEIPLQNVEGVYQVAGGTLPAEIWHDYMGPAVGNLPVVQFPQADLNGTEINGDGTYSYSQSSSSLPPTG